MGIVGALLLVGAFVGGIAWLARPRPEVVIEIEYGKPTVRQGRVPPRFLADCERICTDLKVRKGTITAAREGRDSTLAFSGEIPEAARQRVRNAWNLDG